MQTSKHGASTFDTAYKYTDENGKPLFEHVRWITNDGRGKSFSYRWRPHPKALWDWHKPEKRKGMPFDADDYLYRLPEVLRGIAAGEAVHWTEGERDANALRRLGLVATSHHGGAPKVHVEQCAWLKEARRVVLYLDRDAPGAEDGLRRWRGLVECHHVDPRRISIRYTKQPGCKDVRDHLALGHPLSALKRLSIDGLRKAASKYSSDTARSAGYAYLRSPKAK